tara:strand:- start:956 stop:1687 length:732 start_codon:yes stop_codon:yes gene_type:complete
MANGKIPDPYSAQEYETLAGGDVGQQYIAQMKERENLLKNLQASAEALAGKGEARKQAFLAKADDFAAKQAQSAYTGRRMGAEAMLADLHGKGTRADAEWYAQMADIDAQALDDDSVAAMAQAAVHQARLDAGTEAQRTMEAVNSEGVQKMVASWKDSYDSIWGADEAGFYEQAEKWARANLPPHMRSAFFETHIMPTYRDWGGSWASPFGGSQYASNVSGGIANQDEGKTNIPIEAPPVSAG